MNGAPVVLPPAVVGVAARLARRHERSAVAPCSAAARWVPRPRWAVKVVQRQPAPARRAQARPAAVLARLAAAAQRAQPEARAPRLAELPVVARAPVVAQEPVRARVLEVAVRV